jgi:ATP-binding cassette subfamily B protein
LLATAALLPFIFVAGMYSSKYVKRSVFTFQRAFETFSKGTLFVLHQMELTRIQASEEEEIRKQIGHLNDLRSSGEDMAFRFAVHSQIQNTLTGIAVIIILVVGGSLVATGQMSLGEFIAFYVAAGLLNTYMNNIVNALPQIITGNESMVTLEKLARTETTPPYNGNRQIDFDGTISLHGVSFSYGDEPILTDIDLETRPGEIVALIGPNGAGKSTIVHMVLGFYRPGAGYLTANGVDYDELDIAGLRRQIGVVQQHPGFFPGTIAENIRYGTTNIRHEDIVRAAQSALFDEFIEGLSDGYDSPVGANGILLSGGQCQRMAIARALLRNPGLLILDEPTNHLDTETVGRLLENISCLDNSPAILIISHDPAVVSIATRVYRLANGILLPTDSPASTSTGG